MNVLQHEALVFRGDFGLDSSPFSGPPSDENTAEWKALYNRKSLMLRLQC